MRVPLGPPSDSLMFYWAPCRMLLLFFYEGGVLELSSLYFGLPFLSEPLSLSNVLLWPASLLICCPPSKAASFHSSPSHPQLQFSWSLSPLAKTLYDKQMLLPVVLLRRGYPLIPTLIIVFLAWVFFPELEVGQIVLSILLPLWTQRQGGILLHCFKEPLIPLSS